MSTVIVSYSRTPIGSFMGSLSSVKATELGSVSIKGTLSKSGIDNSLISDVILGNVLSAGLGQAPARQAAILSGLDYSTNCLTINKMCGSGLHAIMLADQIIRNDEDRVIIAGGMENMSLSPHYLSRSRVGRRLGHGKIIDGMIVDGLWDAYNDVHMGNCAEMCAEKFSFTREEQDDYAIESYNRSIKTQKEGLFNKEIISVDVKGKKGTVSIELDEEPTKVSIEKIRSLKAVFKKEGTVTAGNASTINDGAASCLVMSEKKAKELGFSPLAKIIGYSSFSQKPEWFTTAPIGSSEKVLELCGLDIKDIDLFEINEAFSVVAMAAIKELNIDPSIVNPYGGAVSLGHPIGASGARIFNTLLTALENSDKSIGMCSICIGGGEANSMIVERLK